MAASRVVCDATTFDFGTMSNTGVVEHVFAIGNQGDEMLTFGRLRACCGATASLNEKQVPPGSNTTLQVKMPLKDRHGSLNKLIFLATNDPKQPHLVFRLKGTVTGVSQPARAQVKQQRTNENEDIVIVPARLTITQTAFSAAPVTRYVALRSRSGTPFTIQGASLPGRAQLASHTRLGDAGWRIEITNLEPSGITDGSRIQLFTDRQSNRVVSIPIRVISQRDEEPPSP
jgi:hypothetical protein